MSKPLRDRAESDFAAGMFSGFEFFRRRVVVDGFTADLRRFPGLDGGPDFVLVHGIGVSSRYFQPLAVELSKRGTVWLVDLPGYGSAPKPAASPSLADHARVLSAVIESAGIQAPVLVGHSMGCQVITQLAVDDPSVSSCLVLLAPTINPAERSFREASFRLFQDVLREPFRANLVVGTDYFFRCGPAYYLRQLPTLLDDAIEERLGAIDAPTLVLVGNRDPVVTVEWADQVARLLPHGTLGIVQGPHVIMFTDPAGIAQRIVEHCS